MITILQNQLHHRFLILDQSFGIEESPDFTSDMFDVVFIMTEDPSGVKVILRSINAVTSNKCSYKPFFCSKSVEGKLGLYSSLVDGYFNDIEDPEINNAIDSIIQNRSKFGIQPEHDPVLNTNTLFIRIFRYLLTRGYMSIRPTLIEGSSVGYAIPIFELFHDFGQYHLMELFTFEQIMHEHGYFRIVNYINKLYLCPKCHHSHMLYVETCPKCGTSDISSEEVIHHFRCANVSPEHTYNFGGQLRCPKCKKILRHIGIDYDRPATVFACKNCDHSFLNPNTKAICTSCGEENPVANLMPHDIIECEMTQEGIKAISSPDIGFAIYTDFYDNYLDFSRFVSRVKLLLAERDSSDLIEDMTVGKIWIYNENDITEPFTGEIIAEFCKSFKNHKVSIANNIVYVNDTIMEAMSEYAIDSFRIEISEAIHRAVKYLRSGQRLCYSVALLDNDIQTVNQYLQKLSFTEANPDESYSYDEWYKMQSSYTSEFVTEEEKPEKKQHKVITIDETPTEFTLDKQFENSKLFKDGRSWYDFNWASFTGWAILILVIIGIVAMTLYLMPHSLQGIVDMIDHIIPTRNH